jgi:Domain of unknown function (DUF1918)
MATVGDRVQVPTKRVGQTPRDGVVTGVSGALLRVTWSTGEESTIFPSMGSLVVVGRVRARPKKATAAAPTSKKSAKKTVKKTVSAPKAAKRSSSKKAAAPVPKKTAKGPAEAKGAGPKRPSSKGQGRAGKRRK